ncbi:MAG: hypothetical protein AAGI01_18360 [Myxococcota bacterium]
MVNRQLKKFVSCCTLASFVALQTGCYNTYFINQTELEKLESSIEQKEQVYVFGDCADNGAAPAKASRGLVLDGSLWAQADEGDTAAPATASDATDAAAAEPEIPVQEGCTTIPVSTSNAIKVVMDSGERLRITPFNFVMENGQLVSPEYDTLEQLSDVEGAEVRQFSTWKTVATVVGTTIITVGAFVAIGLLADDSEGF